MQIIDVATQEEIDKFVNNDRPTILLFHAPAWCTPCKLFHPVYEMAAQRTPTADFLAYDIVLDIEVAKWYGVSGVPTVLGFYDGDVVTLKQRSPITFINEVREFIDDHKVRMVPDQSA